MSGGGGVIEMVKVSCLLKGEVGEVVDSRTFGGESQAEKVC